MDVALSTKTTQLPIFQNPAFIFKQRDEEQKAKFSSNRCYEERNPNFSFEQAASQVKHASIEEHNLNMVPLFEKVVTPSDVGKLNRLVVPKQHAERHFPRLEAPAVGTELCFEDCTTRKHWRFRFTYWTSSQSYVMTKGWSGFVRQKRLSAGDTVYFLRDSACLNRLFISYQHGSPLEAMMPNPNTDCRRRKVKQFTELVTGLHSETTYCSARSEKRIRIFGVNLEFLDPEKGRISVVEPNCVPSLDLKLGF